MTKKHTIALFVAGIILIGTSAAAWAASDAQTVQQQIDGLLLKLRLASEEEQKTGTVEQTTEGIAFVGESAQRMATLHDQTQTQIDALIARSPAQRESAIMAIKSFARNADLDVIYRQTIKSTYDNGKMSEIYYAGTNQYEVMVSDNQIVQFGPRPLSATDQRPTEYTIKPELSIEELEKRAMDIVAMNDDVDLMSLNPQYSDKDSQMYFFRWIDESRTLQDGMNPFVQVGISVGGELASYTNTLSL